VTGASLQASLSVIGRAIDSEATVAAFTVRLRDEIDVGAVTDDLASTTRAAVAPASMSLWLRSGHSNP
jgi:hypothetical protein